MKSTLCSLSIEKELVDLIRELDCHNKEIYVSMGLGNQMKSGIFVRCHPLGSILDKFN